MKFSSSPNETDTSILPVNIGGSFNMMEKLSWLMSGLDITVTCSTFDQNASLI